MSDSWMGALELVLVFGLVIGLAVRELVNLRRDNEAAKALDAQRRNPASRPAPGSAGPSADGPAGQG